MIAFVMYPKEGVAVRVRRVWGPSIKTRDFWKVVWNISSQEPLCERKR